MRSCSFSAAGVCTTVRFGFAGTIGGAAAVWNWNRLISPQAPSTRHAHTAAGATRARRLIPLSRRPINPSTSTTRASPTQRQRLVSAEYFYLSWRAHFNSRASMRLDPAANPNSLVLEGLRHKTAGFDRRHHAP